jgi:hypothetical protein
MKNYYPQNQQKKQGGRDSQPPTAFALCGFFGFLLSPVGHSEYFLGKT